MKAEHILLLVLAGAVVGAGLMKVVQHQPAAAIAAVKTETAALPPVPAPPEPVAPPPAAEVPPAAPQPAVDAPASVPAEPVEKTQPAPIRPHTRSTAGSRSVSTRVQSFDAKPSPFVVHQIPIVAQAQPSAPAAPPAETPRPAPAAAVQQPAAQPTPAAAPQQQTSIAPSLPPARVEPEPAAPAPPPPPPTVTLNAGMLIPVRLVDGLSSERNVPGDTFRATLDQELVAEGFVIAERGARVEGRVLATSHGGRARGDAELVVELTHVNTSDGQRVPILTDSFHKQMEPNRSQDAEKIAAGAVIGAAIGAAAAAGKGAAIGAGVGGGAGAGTVLLSRKPATLPSETRLTFRLNAPVTLTERR